MSGIYNEWSQDRAMEAWEDINKIAEIYEAWNEFRDGGAAYECWSQVMDILKEGKWV